MREYIAISWKVRLIQAHPALIKDDSPISWESMYKILLHLEKHPWSRDVPLVLKRIRQETEIPCMKTLLYLKVCMKQASHAWNTENSPKTEILCMNTILYLLYWENSSRIWDSRSKNLDIFWEVGPIQTCHTWNPEHSPWLSIRVEYLALSWKVRLSQMHPASNKENSPTFLHSLYKSLDISWNPHLIKGCHTCTWREFSKELGFHKKINLSISWKVCFTQVSPAWSEENSPWKWNSRGKNLAISWKVAITHARATGKTEKSVKAEIPCVNTLLYHEKYA